MEELDGLGDRLEELELQIGGAEAVVRTFTAELGTLQGAMTYTNREVSGLSRAFGSGLKRAFDGVVFDGLRASQALEVLARSMANAAYNTALRPVTTALGGALTAGVSGLFAQGGAFSQGRVTPFARGGVVGGPTTFPMRGGLGLMGEAGPEAIMPLTRGADGKLGVAASGGGGAVHVTMNISTPDAASFRRSQSQVAAQVQRALARGARNR